MRPCNAEKLVVFGAGYLGGVVAREGVARGMRVTGLTRNAETARELEAAGVEAVVAELGSEEWHERIGAADFVVNCTGAGGGGVKGYRKSYVEGMKSVVAWLRRSGGVAAGGGAAGGGAADGGAAGGGTRGFVYTSSTSVYSQSGGVVVREGDEVAAGGDVRAQFRESAACVGARGDATATGSAGILPAGLGACSMGGASRRQPAGSRRSQSLSRHLHAPSAFADADEDADDASLKRALLLEAEKVALRGGACVLRLAGIYGPGRHALLDQMRAGAAMLPGRADSRLNLIHRDDAAAAIWAVLERGGAGGSGSAGGNGSACESGGADGSGSACGNGSGSAGEGLGGEFFRGEIFNVCDDEACLRGEVAEWLARRLDVRAPAFVEHGASLESGVAAREGAAARGRLDRVISNEKIKTRTGWRPRFTSFREGYEALLRV